jgi:putative transposase
MQLPWHHRPAHRFVPEMLYMITAGTLDKIHYFQDAQRLELLQNIILNTLDKHGWIIQAWAVLVNHYHFIAISPRTGGSLKSLIQELHSIASRELNRLDGISGRKVWFQYWDTCLTYENSWLARLNYVNNNAVHHGIVRNATDYPYCSASWFQQQASPVFFRKVKSFRNDRLKIRDDF